MFKTDLEIAQECVMDPILKVAEKIGLKEDDLEYYGKYKAKLSDSLMDGEGTAGRQAHTRHCHQPYKSRRRKINDDRRTGRCLA